MSRILRRPMFRGGKVIDSRGTGITSGLMDGGRVGYQKGDLVVGSDLYKPADFSKFINQNFAAGRKTEGFSPAFLNQMFDSEGNLKEDFTYENIFAGNLQEEKPKSMFEDNILEFSDVGIAGDKASRISPNNKKFANLLKTDVLSKLKESKQYDTGLTGGGADAAQPDFGKEKSTKDDDPNKDNTPSNTKIDAKDLIRENAELFKELLNEGQKEKIKEARIQDLSDLGLDIFAKSQQEGATVGSTLGGAAASLVGKDSRVDKAKAEIDKGGQTAVALAINDYIAGKRSKEATDQLIAKLRLSAELKEGSIGDQILAVAARQTLTGGKIKEILGVAVGEGEGKGIRTIPTGEENNYKPGPEDEGFFFFEEGTKNVFKYEDGVLKPIYAPN